MARQLRPILLKEMHWQTLQRSVGSFFHRTIYEGLFTIFAEEVDNAQSDPLDSALRSGQVYFENGRFFGEINSRITRRLREIGAVYSQGAWRLLDRPLPIDLAAAAVVSTQRFAFLRAAIVSFLDGIDVPYAIAKADFRPEIKTSLGLMDASFQKTVSSISVMPKFTMDQKDRIAAEWSDNLKLYVQKWSQDEIGKLRAAVMSNALQGRRAEALEGVIESSFNSSKKKARFLARQETALLMSKFREVRYGAMGITRYKWSTSHDERVRPFHKDLNGQVFSWSDPPIVDKLGNRANAGEDFNCRCVAIPIFEGE